MVDNPHFENGLTDAQPGVEGDQGRDPVAESASQRSTSPAACGVAVSQGAR